MIKSVRLTKATKPEQWALSDARFACEKAKGSTGADQKARERDIRDMLNVDGITYSRDLCARSTNRTDCFTRDRHGNMLHLEVKHGGGALAYASQYDMESLPSCDRDLCLVNVDYVIYNAVGTTTKRTAMAREYRVASREDFLDMLAEYCHGKRSGGWSTAVKFNNASHTAINIQSQYVEQFWAGLRTDSRSMCLWDFCTNVLGRDPRWEL